MRIYLNIKNRLRFIMLIVLSAFICNIPVYADVIGCDSDGIVCLNDDLEIYSNEFRTLDLDFDGKYELYYFDVNGRLKTNSFIKEYYLNEKGQKTISGKLTIVDVEPSNIITYQIDNTDCFYINKVKSKFNENFEVNSSIDEKLKAKVNIDIPEIYGKNKHIVDSINNILNTSGLELLKIYAKNEVYKRNTRKINITINKFMKDDVQKLNFIPMLDNKFYFNFDVIITLDNKNELHKNIGICATDNICYITNFDLQYLNNQIYQDDDYIDTIELNSYTSKYKDYLESLKIEYIDDLISYIDKYENYIKEYEDRIEETSRKIKAINNYIKNIDTVYNNYIKIAKKSYNNNVIDKETYNYIVEDFKNPLSKYKQILNNNLQVEINALKEMEISKR